MCSSYTPTASQYSFILAYILSSSFPHQAVAHCHKPLNMEVVVTDSEQRRFDNISSLALEWEVSNISLAAVPKQQLSTLPQSFSAQGQGALRSECLGLLC